MAFDPMAWKDEDGMVYNLYIAVATDACNSTTRTEPCVDGQSIDLWRAPKLHSPPAAWEELGSMFTTRDDYLQKNSRRGEMVTLSYTGHMYQGRSTGWQDEAAHELLSRGAVEWIPLYGS